MTTCRTCFNCIPRKGHTFQVFSWGTCYLAQAKVMADLTACQYYKQRRNQMPVKSTPAKRNTYRDKDDLLMSGFTLPEVLDKPLTILVKREYTWEKFTGLALKVANAEGKFAIVEITAEIPIKRLTSRKFPKLPVKGKFVKKTSKAGNEYYTFQAVKG